MKKRLTAICLAALMILITPCMALASGSYYSYGLTAFDLKRGSSGNDVARVQQRLINLGYLNDRADGAYGPKTAEAVKEFQRRNGIHGESGYAGVATRFTQARLFADDVNAAWSNGYFRLEHNGNYAVRNYGTSSVGGNAIKMNFTFVNKEHANVTAVKCIYWLEDYYGNLVTNGGYSWWDYYTYGVNIGYDKTLDFSVVFSPTSSERSRAGYLRMMIAEIAYSDGEVYITCDPSTEYHYQRSYMTGWA